MNESQEQRIRELLQRADEAAGPPSFGPVTAAGIRRQVRRRQLVRAGVPLAAAATVLIAAGLWALSLRPGGPGPQPQRIASLEEQVKQLQAQTDATLQLVREVLEQDRQERRLAALEAELARIPDSPKEIDRQVDDSVFILVYQADKLYQELNQTDSAVRAYQDIIRLFPTNRWADLARERLSQIEQQRNNKSDGRKGATKWQPRNT